MLSKKILVSIPSAIRTIRSLSAGSLHGDLTFQQFRILTLTYQGLGQSQMALGLQVSPAAISKIVDVLVKKKFLSKSAGVDRRSSELTLTNQGLKVHTLIRSQIEKVLDDNFNKLTKKEQSELTKGLDVLDKLMGYVNEK